jgi:hypothetical protein
MKALEHKESVALIKWRDLSLGKYPELKTLIHIPNGGLRNIRVAQKLKAEGTRAGVSDYLLPVARYTQHPDSMGSSIRMNGLWIELKAGKNKPTDAQYEWLYMMLDQGYEAVWCVGWYEASRTILAYLQKKYYEKRPLKNRAELIL